MPPFKSFSFQFLSLILLFGIFDVAVAQTPTRTAQKFDEFGDILYSDLIARLDNFSIQLMQQPDAKGFLIVYRTRRDLPGLNHALAMRMKDYIVHSRGIQRDRVVTVDGGVAGHLVQELWIVLPGTAPTPRSDARIGYIQDWDFAWKFYETNFLPLAQYKRFGARLDIEGDVEALEAFANEIKKRPNRSGCIIVYAQYNLRPPLVDWSGAYEPKREARLDPAGVARNELTVKETI
jgi:hypothetical protein